MGVPSTRARGLSSSQAAHFVRARELLRAGQSAQALSIAETLVGQAPDAVDAWQLLALCLAESGQQGRAAAAFEHALSLCPGNTTVSRNYGVLLAKQGKAMRMQGQHAVAESLLRKALGLWSEQPSAWVDLGVVLRLQGQVDEALTSLRRAKEILDRRGINRPEIQDAINGVLVDAGRTADALAGARTLVASHPSHAPAYETLSNLLWEHGAKLAPGEDPLGELRAAASAQPDNRALQLVLARMLLEAKREDEALSLLNPLRHRDPGNVLLDWLAADALDALRQHDLAARLYAALARSELKESPEFLNARARHAFRSGDFDLAKYCAEAVIRIDPRNQEGWSHMGSVWRLLGDEREYWLCDYEGMVGYVEVTPPDGFGALGCFLQSLTNSLMAMHSSGREPVSQSVRGGTQTNGRLFGRDDSVIRSAEATLRSSVENWLAALGDREGHPFLSHKKSSVSFVGSWSVNLRSSGHHSNHIHPRGWASSAFYVGLPENMLDAENESCAGWLQLGQPLEDLGLDLSPRRVIQPRLGYVALFPSYMWHGTVPFVAREARLTIAFDMQPRV